MNYVTIQTKILKDISKKNSRCLCQKVDDYYLISTDGHVCFKIPETEMWLDFEKIIKKFGEGTILKKFIEIEGEYGCLKFDTKTIQKMTVRRVASENNWTWIDEKKLGKFEIKKELHFTVSNNCYDPVIVWEEDVLCGFILPVRVKEDR